MWRQGLAEFARGLVQLLYPNACPICDAAETEDSRFRDGLCSSCHEELGRNDLATCPFCATTVGPHVIIDDACPACRSAKLGFDRAIRVGPYAGRLRDAILRMKHAAGEPLAEKLGCFVAQHCAERFLQYRDAIVVPVPLHWRSRWTRGYNQAESLARELARGLRMEFRPRGLRRIKASAQHAQSTATARRANMKGAFRANAEPSLAGRCILLVDDVMTTGSTASEAARTLKAVGAAEVIAFVLARR